MLFRSITDEAIAQTPDLGYYPDYNEGLIKLCQEMGCTFIDNSTIVTDSSENLCDRFISNRQNAVDINWDIW